MNIPDKTYITDEIHSFNIGFDIENINSGTEYSLTVTKNDGADPVFSTSDPADIGTENTVGISPVGLNRSLDVYSVSLRAKNEFDEAYSYDSYNLYVYNSNALRIMVDD